MKRLPKLRRVVVVVVAGLLWSLLAGMPQASATDGVWSTELSDIRPNSVTVHPNGAVSVTDCGYHSQPANSVMTWKDGVVQNAVPVSSLNSECGDSPPIPDPVSNVLYVVRSSSSTFNGSVAAISGNQVLWEVVFPCKPNNIFGMVMGSDGDIYVSYKTFGCSGYSYKRLFAVDTSSHSMKFDSTTGISNEWYRDIQAYQSGLVLRDNSHFRFFNYSGVENASLEYDSGLGTGDYLNTWTVNPAGTVFVTIVGSDACSSTPITRRVVSRTVAGVSGTWNLISACLYQSDRIQSTPAGGAVTVLNGTDPSLLLLDQDGSIDVRQLALPRSNAFSVYTVGFQVDSFGNIMLMRSYRHNDAGDDYETEVSLFGPTGNPKSHFTTEIWDTNGSDNFNSSSANYVYSGSVVRGAVFFATGGYLQTLHRVSFSELGHEYVASELFGLDRTPINTLKLAVSGDSYSSGEGDPDFLEATDRPGINECHRSKTAYAKLLDQDPSAPLSLTAFTACSGATTVNIVTAGKYDESKQLDAIPADADRVLITIGGNDAGFGNFVTKCLFLDCSSGTIKQPFFDAVASLGTALSNVYSQILVKAPNADVYVLGYPQLLPASGCNQTDAFMVAIDAMVSAAHNGNAIAIEAMRALGASVGLTTAEVDDFVSQGQFEFNLNEVATARDFVDALDAKISDTVGTSNSRLHFVSATGSGSPFAGHELCTTTPYFNGLDGVNQVYSYHPNALGQQAYADLAKSSLG